MPMEDGDFKKHVYRIVRLIPKGRTMTYGQIAALAGQPRAARIVGGIAHNGDQTLPWQRVVHADGRLAAGYPGGVEGHRQVLESEGVQVSKDYRVDIERLKWNP
jgi:methylated-DNA-protein-cysteine methyltransferase-like protein